jgi:hypothetical protein
MIWYGGMVWYGMVWRLGMVWYGMGGTFWLWYGMDGMVVGVGMVWYGVGGWYGMVWYGGWGWYGVVWYGIVVGVGMVWYGGWDGMVWYHTPVIYQGGTIPCFIYPQYTLWCQQTYDIVIIHDIWYGLHTIPAGCMNLPDNLSYFIYVYYSIS